MIFGQKMSIYISIDRNKKYNTMEKGNIEIF